MSQPAWPPPPRRRLWLMRHGSVAYFGPGASQSFGEAVLTDEGCRQADAAGAFLASRPIDHVITSGLARAEQTAVRVKPGIRAGVDPRWREIEPGDWNPTGGPDPSRLEEVLSMLGPGLTPESRFFGGETFGSLHDRVGRALSDLLADTAWAEALVVAHSVALRSALLHCLGGPLDGICRIEQDAGCLNLVESAAGGPPLVRLVNHTPPDAGKHHLRLSSLEELVSQALEHRPRPKTP